MIHNITKAIFGLTITILLFFAIWNPIWSNGDEVHYLVVTGSLIKDKDFDLKNNYDNKDYFTHHAKTEGMHAFKDKNNPEILRPYHGVLLSVVLIPGFYARDLLGSRVNMLVYVLIGIYFLYLLLKEFGFTKNIRLLTLSLFLIQAPIIYHSSSIYPDILMGLTMVISAYFIIKGMKTKANYWYLFAGLVSGVSIFFHYKILALSVFLFFATLLITFEGDAFRFVFDNPKSSYKLKFDTKNLKTTLDILLKNILRYKQDIINRSIFILGPIFIFTLLASWLSYVWFGYFRPDFLSPLLAGVPEIAGYANPFYNLTGMLFDSDQGLFFSGPILALIIPGLFLWYKNNKLFFIALALPSIAFLLTQALFRDWTAGWAPMARYTMTSLPLLVPALAYIVVEAKKSISLKIIIAILVIVNLIFLLITFKYDYTGYPNGGINFFLQKIFERLNLTNLSTQLSFNFLSPQTVADSNQTKELVFTSLAYLGLIFYGLYLSYGNFLKSYFDRKKGI